MDNKSKQQRDTRQRRMIYDNVMSRCDHPGADEIYLDVHSQDEKISKGTVYRNLGILSENGDILHVRVPGADRYDSRLDNHYHILCTECGRVIDAPIEYNKKSDLIVEEQTGFVIKRHRAFFEGICPECLAKNK